MAWSGTIRTGLAWRIVLFAVYFGMVVGLQWRANAFQTEFGSNPDEPAHYVTGLMVRDYVAQGFPGPPVAFARNYYVHYPKVALGHWPPVFYIVQAVWTLVFTPSRTSVMLLMAAITALLALALAQALSRELSVGIGVSAGALLISLPVMEQFSRAVMSEMLVALLSFLAVLAYGRYLDTQRWQPAAWFGIWATLAILTNGSAIQLALVPLLAILLSGRWRLFGTFGFWLPAILVCAIAGPWYWFVPGAQHEMVARGGGIMFDDARLIGTSLTWAKMLGVVPLIAGIFGLYLYATRFRHSATGGIWTAGIASVLGAYLIRPFIGAYEDRHLLVSLPVLIMFAAAGVDWLIHRPWWQGWAPAWKASVAAVALIALMAFNIRNSPVSRVYGFSEVAQNLVSHPEFKNSVILVSSGATGEGMLISEIAMRESRPGHIVLRASKMLATVDWMGWDYHALFHDQKDLLAYLQSVPVGIVVIDSLGPRTPDGQLLYETLEAHPEMWERLPGGGESGRIAEYRLIGLEGKLPGKIRIPMRFQSYGSFEN